MGFSRKWSGLPFPSPGDLPDLGIEPRSPELQADSLPAKSPGKPKTEQKYTQRDRSMLSCDRLFATLWTVARQAPGKNTGVGCHALLQGIFPTQELNPSFLHCRQTLYRMSYQGSPRILEWITYPYSRDLPDPEIEPGSPALQADYLPAELPGKPAHAFSSMQF